MEKIMMEITKNRLVIHACIYISTMPNQVCLKSAQPLWLSLCLCRHEGVHSHTFDRVCKLKPTQNSQYENVHLQGEWRTGS